MLSKIIVISKSGYSEKCLSECLEDQYDIIYTKIDDLVCEHEEIISLYIIEYNVLTEEIRGRICQIKHKVNIPILFLAGTKTIQQRIDEKVQAIELGVDEYYGAYTSTSKEIRTRS